MNNHLCPCGSKRSYDNCCGPIIDGVAKALTAEALMRSRYCAFTQKNGDYLLASWHPTTRPEEIDLVSDPVEWVGLKVVKTKNGRESDTGGEVTFRASFEHQGEPRESGEQVERSRFVQEAGSWYYLDGELPQSSTDEKVGRNSLCPCGSGKKFKRCCGG